MPNTSRLRIAYLSYLSTPAKDRPIYRAICRHKARKILELGIGDAQRASRMIEVAQRFRPRREIQFTGIDRFEARSAMDGPGVTLKMAHRLLSRTGARIQLVPGDPLSGLARVANGLRQIDLMVISPRLAPGRIAGAWFYVPRILHEGTQVFLEKLLPGGRSSLRLLTPDEIETLAAAAAARRRAA